MMPSMECFAKVCNNFQFYGTIKAVVKTIEI